MTRVSENSSHGILRYGLNKNRGKLEELQLKGTTLKNINRPSDNPSSNVELLTINSRLHDNNQYLQNIDQAKLQLNITEKSLEQLTDIMVKAKETAVAQASDLYNPETRKNVAYEIQQLRNHALITANKRLGQRYIFSGSKSLQRPFSDSGEYLGNRGKINLEVAKDFFIPINLHGAEVFHPEVGAELPERLKGGREENLISPLSPARDLASTEEKKVGFQNSRGLFYQLDQFIAALESNDVTLIQSLLERFDDSIDRLITLRTQAGSIINSIENSRQMLESDNVDLATRKSTLEDADVAELVSNIAKQKHILEASYKAGQGLINQSLLSFLK